MRDGLYLSMMEFHKAIFHSYTMMNDNVLQGREWELWKPILAIASVIDDAKGGLFQEIRTLALEIQENRKEAHVEDSTAQSFFKLSAAFKERCCFEKFYSITELREYLKSENEEEFGWIINNKHGRWLGQELRKAGIVKDVLSSGDRRCEYQGLYLNLLSYKSALEALICKFLVTWLPP
jgi:hypothetical protein